MDLKSSDFKLFQEIISEKSGLHFTESKKEALRVSLLTRIKFREFENFKQYYRFLKVHPDGENEFRELLTLLTINETSFFRNPEQFDVLKKSVLTELIEKNTDRNIKIWSAGCSTGEEPYSIAITLLETINNPDLWNIELLGTDVDKSALSLAKEGVYRKKSLRITPKEYIDKYFIPENGGFIIGDKVKKMVNFDYFNLTDEMYPAPLKGKWDIIFCRNVLIYFNQENVSKTIKKFSESLNENGYFFPGYSEILSTYESYFKPVRFGGIYVYRKKVKQAEPEAEQKKETGRLEISARLKKEKEKAETLYKKAVEYFIREEFEQSLDSVEKSLELDSMNPGAHLIKGRIYFERSLYEKAQMSCREAAYLNPFMPEAHYMLGLTFAKLGKTDEALNELRTAVSLNRNFAMAYYNIAVLLETRDRKEALREYIKAVKAADKQPEDEFMELSGGFTEKLLIDICRKKIKEIKKELLM